MCFLLILTFTFLKFENCIYNCIFKIMHKNEYASIVVFAITNSPLNRIKTGWDIPCWGSADFLPLSIMCCVLPCYVPGLGGNRDAAWFEPPRSSHPQEGGLDAAFYQQSSVYWLRDENNAQNNKQNSSGWSFLQQTKETNRQESSLHPNTKHEKG